MFLERILFTNTRYVIFWIEPVRPAVEYFCLLLDVHVPVLLQDV